MTEGIEFNPIGTIDVTFDDKTYHLGRPKMRQFRHFTERLTNQRQEVQDKLAELEARAKDDENVAAELAEFARDPFYDRTIPLLAEIFDQVGDPLPPDADDWPAWLAADSSLPGKILAHWRVAPKVSGTSPPS